MLRLAKEPLFRSLGVHSRILTRAETQRQRVVARMQEQTRGCHPLKSTMPMATRAFGKAGLTPVMAGVRNTAIVRRQMAFIKCYSVIIMIVLAGYGGTAFGITLGSKWAKQSQLKQSNPGSHAK